MKTIFITGASSGIGRETAKYFSDHGWRVIATMRNLKKAGDLDVLPEVVIMPLDLTNPRQIEETCQRALGEYDVDAVSYTHLCSPLLQPSFPPVQIMWIYPM